MNLDGKHWRMLAAILAVPMPALVSHAEIPPAPTVVSEANTHFFTWSENNILGTSLEIQLAAKSQEDADVCHATIMGEINRLRGILSTYEAGTEISKLMANSSRDEIAISEELHAVLWGYTQWRNRSSGACSPQLAELIELWTKAEKKGAMPGDSEIAALVAKVAQNAYSTPLSGNTVHKLNDQALNIDSLGKGYIVQKAAALARLKHPAVTGILLDIGGDITALGFSTPPGQKPTRPWDVGVADPQQPADNAPPLTTLHISGKAVATSGVYARYYTIGGKKLSHILNPLTGRPSDNGVLSATVVAWENMTANALATILCVMQPDEGLKLVERTPGASALLVTSDGKQIRSKSFSVHEQEGGESAVVVTPLPKPPPTPVKPEPRPDPAKPDPKPAVASGWSKGSIVGLDLNVLPFQSKAPYVAVWIEDSSGQCVKILAAWVGNRKYLPSLTSFAKVASGAADFSAMSRATRTAGHYPLIWDGSNNSNGIVAPGTYNVCVEVSYEHGGRQMQKVAIDCAAAKSNGIIPKTKFWDDIAVVYGPK